MKSTIERVIAQFLVAILITILPLRDAIGQTFNDGPIQLQARLRDFNLTFNETDLGFFGIVGQPDDLTYNLWLRDAADVDGVVANGGWGAGSGCLTEGYTASLIDWNLTLFNFTYPGATVPQFLDMRVDFWEDESPDVLLGFGCGGTRCAYNTNFCCGGFLFGSCVGQYDDDDLHCISGAVTPYATLNYRLGPPCQWYNHGYVGGVCANNVYNPRMETFWRYTGGENCSGTPIVLGNVAPGLSAITHFNSNECYADDIAFPGGGRDVVYQFTVTSPVGLNINTCGTGLANTDLYVIDACGQPPASMYSNSAACGSGSRIIQPFCTPGVYYIVVEGRAGSQGTFTLSITEDASVIVRASAGPNVAVCTGLGVTVGAQLPTMPAAGGVPGYSYSWTPNTFITSNTDSITTVFPPATTQYVLAVTDALGCISRDTMIVTVNPGPSISLGPNQTVCPAIPVTLNAGNGFNSYFWNTGSFLQQVTVSNPGQYIAVVTDLNGCIGRDTMDLFNFATPNINLGIDTSICVGANITFDAGPGFNVYNWSTSGATQSIVANSAGSYQVTVSDLNGCIDRDTILLTIDTLPIPVLPATINNCPGDNAVLNPGAGWPNYLWSSGSTNQVVITNVVGPYTVTVTDGNGCQGTANTSLVNYTSPVGFGVTAPLPAICQGSSVTIDAGTSASISSYLWNNGANTQTISVNAAGWYEVTATDVNGCEWLDSIQISVNPNPVVALGADTTICQGNTLTLTAPPGMNYAWSTGGVGQTETVSTANTYTVTVTDPVTGCNTVDQIVVAVTPNPVPSLPATASFCAGQSTSLDPGAGFNSYTWSNGSISQSISVNTAGTYTVTVTNANGCVSTASTTVSAFAPIVVSVTGNASGCEGTPESISATPGFVAYDWSNGASGAGLSITSSGTYTVTVTDANGCTESASHVIVFNTLPVVSLGGTDTLCDGNTTLIDAGPGFTNYAWSTSATTQSITVGSTGSYTVTVTDGNGCSNSDTKDLIGSTVAPVDLGPATLNICDNGTAILDAGPQYIAYAWAPQPTPNQYLVVNQAGNYTVTVTDQFGCNSTDNVTVTVNAETPLTFMVNDTVVCAGQDLLLDAGDQWLNFEWNTGSPDQYLVVNAAATYEVTVTDSAGCRFTDTTKVTIDTPPAFELGPNISICPGEQLTLFPGAGFATYLWSTGETTDSIFIIAPGVYAVTATFNSCVLDDNVLIGDDCPGEIFIPNVFTPNGDGLNDGFKIDYVNLESLSITIYDRWGKNLFQSGDKDFVWDGTFNGRPVPEGVYYYHCDYKLNANANQFDTKGSITLLR